jgi:hypothetical protein
VKRLLMLAIMAGLMAFLPFGGSAVAATNAGGCQLHGTASFTPPLTNTAQSFNYSFTGSLSNCQSSAGGPATGTVFAGTNGLQAPSGNGSCASSTTSGIAVAQWADGTATVIEYTTTGAAAAVGLQGSVIPAVGSSNGTTYTTTRYVGDAANGAVAFEPPDPTACAGAGVTTAGIDGVVGLDSP